jgi:mono/diheme cytochrome c family protein
MKIIRGTVNRFLIATLLFFASTGAWAQQATFDGGTGVLTLPAVKVGAATYTNVLLGLINPANYTFMLQAATPQTPAGPADITFDGSTGVVTIPSVAVGSVAYSVTLQLTDISTYTFVLATATLITTTATTLTQIQANVFTPRCSGCHDPGGDFPNLKAGSSFAALVNVASEQKPSLMLVKPGDPANSYLIQKLEHASGIVGMPMPPGGSLLDQATIDQIKSWITAGAANN